MFGEFFSGFAVKPLHRTSAAVSGAVLDESAARASTGYTVVALPALDAEARLRDLSIPDPGVQGVLDRLPPPLSRRHGRVIVLSAVAGEPTARIAFKLARLAQVRSDAAVVIDAKLGIARAWQHVKSDEVGGGLADYLVGHKPLDALVRHTKAGGLAVVTAGQTDLPASSLLSTRRWPRAVRHLRGRFETIVVIAPAVGTDGFSDIASRADGIVLIADRHLAPDYLSDRADLIAAMAPKAALIVSLL